MRMVGMGSAEMNAWSHHSGAAFRTFLAVPATARPVLCRGLCTECRMNRCVLAFGRGVGEGALPIPAFRMAAGDAHSALLTRMLHAVLGFQDLM